MYQLNNITKILGATVLLVGSSAALAETVTVPATVTVDNTIDFALVGTMDFGIVRATVDPTSTECVGLTLPADPTAATTAVLGTAAATACTAGAGDAVIQSVGGTLARPAFTVGGLPAFTSLVLTVPSGTSDLTLAIPPAGAPVLQLIDFTAHDTGADSAVALTSGVGAVVADAAGDIAFSVGATLITDPGTPTLTYQNVAYTGSYDVTVAY